MDHKGPKVGRKMKKNVLDAPIDNSKFAVELNYPDVKFCKNCTIFKTRGGYGNSESWCR